MGRKFITIPEAAEERGSTPKAIRMGIYRGHIPHCRWGRRVLIPRDQWDEFLQSLPGINAKQALERIEEKIK